MPVSEHRRRDCLRVMDTILSFHISRMFSQPVDPERDQCPTYFTIITKPMDLGTVKNKLLENKYNSITEWKADVEQVWENAYTFNGKTSVVALLAKQLQGTFGELTEFFTDDETLDWIYQLNDQRNKLNTLMNSSSKMKLIKPKSKSSSKPSGLKPVSSTSSKTPKRTNSKQNLSKTASQPHVRRESTPSLPPPPRQFTEEDTIRLTEDFNSLQTDDDVGKVTNLIMEYEPELLVGEEVEIEVGKLKYETLVALRNLVTQLLNKNK